MASPLGNPVLRAALSAAGAKRLTDRELLTQFAEGDQAAFEAIVKRHTGLVLGVCRRVLPTVQDAEDACQAAFLILARKAKTGRWQPSIGNWLYITARRIALSAQRSAARRMKRQSISAPPAPVSALDEMTGREAFAALDGELEKLSAIYREPLVLFYLQGLTRDEAAACLGIPAATLKSRLDRGRKKLADALTKRGIDIGAGLIAVAASSSVGASSPRLVESILTAVGGSPSASVAAIAKGVAMNGFSLKVKLLALAAVIAGVAGFGLASMQIEAGPQKPAMATSKQPAVKPVDSSRNPEPKPPTLRVDHFGDPLPDDALARFGTVRFRQGPSTCEIRYSPDEKVIAIGSALRWVGLWDAATGKELLQFDARGEVIGRGLAFSPDGKLLAASGVRDVDRVILEHIICLWNVKTGKLIRELKLDAHQPGPLVFSPDGKEVISGGDDKTIRFWDVVTGSQIAKLESADVVRALGLSSNGRLLASAGNGQQIRIWDTNTRRLVKQIQVPRPMAGDDIHTLSFSPDGKQLVSTCYSDWPCQVWDLNNGELAYRIVIEHKNVESAVFSPDGKWLAVGCSGGTIHLYDAATRKEVRSWETHMPSVWHLMFSKGSKMIVSSGLEAGLRFWNVETGKEDRPITGHQSKIDGLQISTDGNWLWSMSNDDRQVIRWDRTTREPVETVAMPSSFRYPRGALSPGGAYLAWGSPGDRTVHLMDLKTHKDACSPLKTETDALSVRFSPDCNVVAVGCKSGLFYTWKWKTERNPKPVKVGIGPEDVCVELFTSDGKQMVTGDIERGIDTLDLWDVATGKKILSFLDDVASCALTASPDGKWVISTFVYHDHINVVDLKHGKLARKIMVQQGGMALTFSPDGSIIAFGERENQRSAVKLLEFATG